VQTLCSLLQVQQAHHLLLLPTSAVAPKFPLQCAAPAVPAAEQKDPAAGTNSDCCCATAQWPIGLLLLLLLLLSLLLLLLLLLLMLS
jgi:hypothetical protein